MNEKCDRCDTRLTGSFMTTLFTEDGTEQKVPMGIPPAGFRGVVVRICSSCPGGYKNKASRGVGRHTVDDGSRTYEMTDVTIKRKGERILALLPWSVK